MEASFGKMNGLALTVCCAVLCGWEALGSAGYDRILVSDELRLGSVNHSVQADTAENEGYEEESAEADGPVNDVPVRELHLHVLPGFADVPAGDPDRAAHQGDGESLHHRPCDDQHHQAQDKTQQAPPEEAQAERWSLQRQHGGGRVADQSQLVVEVGRHGDARTRTQDLSGVASGCAPRVQGEGEKPQHGVERDDEDGSVSGRQGEGVEGIQSWIEHHQDEQAVEEPHNHILKGEKKLNIRIVK